MNKDKIQLILDCICEEFGFVLGQFYVPVKSKKYLTCKDQPYKTFIKSNQYFN